MPDEPQSEAEYYERQSQLAREALKKLRGEMLDSLRRIADADAWTRRYPWQSLGTAAIAGLGTGWALGRTFRHKPAAGEGSGGEAQADAAAQAAADVEKPSAASRLVGGLGTLTGALASAAFTAAAEAIKDIVTDSVHGALNPNSTTDTGSDEVADSSPDSDSDPPAPI